MFGFGKRNCRKDELFMSLSRTVDENTSAEQREKMMAGSNLISMQIGLAFKLLRNGSATSQLSDEEFKFFLIIRFKFSLLAITVPRSKLSLIYFDLIFFAKLIASQVLVKYSVL